MGINNLVVSTCEKSVDDSDIRLAYFERTNLSEFIKQL